MIKITLFMILIAVATFADIVPCVKEISVKCDEDGKCNPSASFNTKSTSCNKFLGHGEIERQEGTVCDREVTISKRFACGGIHCFHERKRDVDITDVQTGITVTDGSYDYGWQTAYQNALNDYISRFCPSSEEGMH